MAWLDSQGNYYEGDRASLSDKGVPTRPSPDHIYVDGEWVEDPAILSAQAAAADLAATEAIKTKLKEIDIASIRSIREYIAAKPDAPQYVKDYELQAISERDKLTVVETEPVEEVKP
jgi:hypothetical protein